MVPVCKVCRSYMLPHAKTGRPPATCSKPCKDAWNAARQKALRARRRALDHLKQAELSLWPVNPLWKAQIARYYRKLEKAKPAELVHLDQLQRHSELAQFEE